MEDEKNLLISIKLDENKIAAKLKDINKNIEALESENKNLQKSIDGVGDRFGIFGKKIQENNDKIKELQNYSNSLQSQLSNVSREITNVSGSTGKFNTNLSKLDNSLEETGKDLKSNATDFKNYSSSVIDASNSTVDFEENNKRLEAVINSNKEALERLGNSAKELKLSTKELDDIVVALSNHPITLDTTNAINATIALKENLLKVGDAVEDLGKENLSTVLGGVNKLKNALPICSQCVDILNQSFKNLGYDAEINMNAIATSITSIAGIVEGLASENYAQVATSSIPLIEQGLDLLTKKIREIREGCEEFTGIWKTLNYETTVNIDNINTLGKSIREKLNDKFTVFARDVAKFFRYDLPNFYDDVIQVIGMIIERIRNGFFNVINSLNTKFKNLFGVDLLNALDDALIKMSSAFYSFIDSIGSGFREMFNDIASGVDSVLERIGTKRMKEAARERKQRRAAQEEELRDYEDNLVARAAKRRKARRKEYQEEQKDFEDNEISRWARERQQRRQAEEERRASEIKRKQEAAKTIEELDRLERESNLRREQRLTEIEKLNREMQNATFEERKRLEGEILQLQLRNAEERATLEQKKLKLYEDGLKKVKAVYDEATGSVIESKVDVEPTKEQAEILNQLRINAEKAKRELENLAAANESYNSTFRNTTEIYKSERELAQKKRDYENAEIDRKQKIIELRNREGDTDKEVIEIQKQSLREKIALLEEEIALQERKMEATQESSDYEIDSLHRLQMELKQTQNDLSNLDNGLNANVSNLDSTLDQLNGTIGTVSGALSMFGIQGAGAIKKISTGIKALSKLFTSWVGIAIAALIIAIKGITNAFSENQALMDSLKSVYEAFEPIIDRVKVVFELLARAVALVCDGLAFLIRTLTGTQKAWKEEQERMALVESATERLNEAKRKYARDEEARNQRIIELNKIIADSELKSVDERIAAQEELNKIKEQSLREEKAIADEELRIFKSNNDKRISELERLKRENGKFTESQQEEYEDLISKLDELELAAIKAANAMVNAYQDAKDGILSIITSMTEEEIKERLDKFKAEKEIHDAERQLIQDGLDQENKKISDLMNKVMYKNELEEAVIYLREHGIEVLKEEETQWEAIYNKLLQIKKVGPVDLGGELDTEGQAMQQQIDLYQEAYNRILARKKTTTTTTTKSSGKSDAEKEAEAFAKYWEKAFDDASKGLVNFHKELGKAEKDFKELSMTKLQIFDLNMEDTMKELDARKDEIQAKLHEIQNTTTQTPEQEEQKQQSIAYYTEMYNNMEQLRTAITKKAAVERAKIEVEMQKEAQEKIVQEYEKANDKINSNYLKRELATRQGNGETAELSPIQEASLELEKSKEELKLLQETLAKLDPAGEEYQEFADKIIEANLQIMNSTNSLNSAISQTVQSYTNAFSSMTASMDSYYAAEKKSVQNSKKTNAEKEALIKRLEEKERSNTLAQIAFSTASSIAQVVADASKAGWPAMIPILIGGIATVISAIASAKSAMSGYAEGGIIPGTSYTGDKVQARVNSGEMVLTTEQQKQLFDIANGRGSAGMNYELMVSAFSQAVSDMPAPVLDYQEFITFVSSVNQSNNLVKLR